jgi:hypothetical protein
MVTAFTETLDETVNKTPEAPAVTAVIYGSGLIEHIGTPRARYLPLATFMQDTQILGLTNIANETNIGGPPTPT